MIVSPTVLGAAGNQTLETTVNHDLRQDSNTSDLLFGVRRIVSFLSQGTTLKKGSLIMTGTPSMCFESCPNIYIRNHFSLMNMA